MSYLAAEAQERPVSVLFGLDLVERLRTLVKRGRRGSFRGILYGRAEVSGGQRTVLTLEACEPQHGLLPLGLIRSWVRGHLYLDKQDRDILAGSQPGPPYSILLVIRRGRLGPPVAGAFLCESGAVTNENSFVEFPLDRSRILSGNFTVIKGGDEAAAENRPSSKPRAWHGPRWAWIPVATAALLALVGVALWHGSALRSPTDIDERARQSRILLNLQRVGNDLLLRWDPDSPSVRSAAGGMLRITDGAVQRDVPLDSDQLKVGAAQYHPLSNDIEFQLDIPGANGAASDPVRFISGVPVERAAAAEKAANRQGESDRARADSRTRSRATAPAVQISYEAIPPSGLRKAVYKMRGLPLLRLHNGDFVAPQATRQVTPEVSAGQLRADQHIELRANIDRNGRVTSVEPVSRGADRELVAAAESAIRHWQFNPALLDERPVASSVRFTVVAQAVSPDRQQASAAKP